MPGDDPARHHRARHLLADDGALARPRGRRARTRRRLHLPFGGAGRLAQRATCCWPAMPATRRRPSSARACAPACATPPTSRGSSASCRTMPPTRCSTPTRASGGRMCGTFIELAVKLGAILQETDREAPRRATAASRRRRDVRLPATAARPRLPHRCAAAGRHDLPAAAPRRRPPDGRGDRPALRHRRRRRHCRRPPQRCRRAAKRRLGLVRSGTISAPPSCGPTATSMPWHATGQPLEAATLELAQSSGLACSRPSRL